ncbi:hypothetical protein Hanom_Chr00s000326g01637501 [Helianthus anomalus]
MSYEKVMDVLNRWGNWHVPCMWREKIHKYRIPFMPFYYLFSLQPNLNPPNLRSMD